MMVLGSNLKQVTYSPCTLASHLIGLFYGLNEPVDVKSLTQRLAQSNHSADASYYY